MKVHVLFEVEPGPNSSTILKIFSDRIEAETLRDELNSLPSRVVRGMIYEVGEFGIDEDTEWLEELFRTIVFRKEKFNLPVDTS